MLILAIDGALACCAVAVVADGMVRASRQETASRGHAARLAPMAEAVLAQAGIAATMLDAVAVTLGPGSFTGLRAAIALAHGIGTAAGCPVIGVGVPEAIAEAIPALAGRELWVAIHSRRGTVFLHRGGSSESIEMTALPPAGRPVAVAGDAAVEVACRLAARGEDVMLSDHRGPPIHAVALVAARQLRGERAVLPAQPLYIDAPEAKLPLGGLRPAPLPPAPGPE